MNMNCDGHRTTLEWVKLDQFEWTGVDRLHLNIEFISLVFILLHIMESIRM